LPVAAAFALRAMLSPTPQFELQFDKAKQYYDTAENIDLLEGAANVGRAVLQLDKGELGRAEKTLTEVAAACLPAFPVRAPRAFITCAHLRSPPVMESR
jgi:hypothetical protein